MDILMPGRWFEIFNLPGLLKRNFVQMSHEEDPEVVEHRVRKQREHGTSGSLEYQGIKWDEYNPIMQGQQLFDNVDRMKKGDGSIKAALGVLKMPMMRTNASITIQDPADNDPTNIVIAETTQEKLLGKHSMHEPWHAQLSNFLLMFDYGFSVTEKIYDVDEDGFLIYTRLAPRHPKTIQGWRTDNIGKLTKIIQRGFKNGKEQELSIPAPTYGMALSWDKEGDNYWGTSVMRAMYKHYFYKEQLYKIDAVRLDRWGIGTPDAKIKETYELKPTERANLIKMLTGLRGNERAFTMHSDAIELSILTPQGQGGALGLMDSVNHHDVMIFRSILANFMTTGNQKFGNYGSTKNYTDMFLYAEQAAAMFVEEEYGRQIIKPFCDANFNMHGRPYPVLKFADIQKVDMQVVAQTLSSLVSSKVILPEDDLEVFFRKLFGFPQAKKGSKRRVLPEEKPEKNSASPTPNAGGRPKEPSAGEDGNVDQRG
jgi:hypothetical protein